MQVRFTKRVIGTTARPVDDADNARIVEGMRKNGWPHDDDTSPYFAQSYDGLAWDFTTLGLGQEHIDRLYSEGSIEVNVDEWTFRHLCGYQSD